MGQIVQKANNPVRCNLAAIQSGGSKASMVLASGEIWLVDTTNASKGSKGYGKYDAYIVGDGVHAASTLTVVMIDAEAFAEIDTKYSKPVGGIPKTDLASDVQTAVDLATDVVYDISSHNNNTAYASLAAALGTGGANVPQGLRKGGMSVRFVQSSDNNSVYVQYRLMKDSFSTAVGDWQGVDDVITAGSKNLAKSGDVKFAIDSLGQYVLNNYLEGKGVNYVSKDIYGLVPGRKYIVILKSNTWDISGITGDDLSKFTIRSYYDGSINAYFAGVLIPDQVEPYYEITIPDNCDFIRIGGRAAEGVNIYFNIFDIAYKAEMENLVGSVDGLVLNNNLIGNGDTYVSKDLYGLAPGRIYRVVLKDASWDVTGITNTGYKWRIASFYNNTVSELVGVYMSGTVVPYYDIIMPANSDFVRIGCRASDGTKVNFSIVDLSAIYSQVGVCYDKSNTFIARTLTGVSDPADNPNGIRIRIVMAVKAGMKAYAKTTDSLGLNCGIWSSFSNAINASPSSVVEVVSEGYTSGFEEKTISNDGYLCISLTNGSTAISNVRKQEMLNALSFAVGSGTLYDISDTVVEVRKDIADIETYISNNENDVNTYIENVVNKDLCETAIVEIIPNASQAYNAYYRTSQPTNFCADSEYLKRLTYFPEVLVAGGSKVTINYTGRNSIRVYELPYRDLGSSPINAYTTGTDFIGTHDLVPSSSSDFTGSEEITLSRSCRRLAFVLGSTRNENISPSEITQEITKLTLTVYEPFKLKGNNANNYSKFIERVAQAKYVDASPTTNSLGLLHFSDIHGDQIAADTINNYLKDISSYIDDVICTGDSVHYYADGTSTYPQGSTWWNEDSGLSEKSLFVLGNHDGATPATTSYDQQEGSAAWDGKGKDWCFETYIEPYINQRGITMPEGYDNPSSPNYNACYWHKDYAQQKIRIIGLDCIHRFDGVVDPETGEITTPGLKWTTNEQELWLISKLNEIYDANNAAYGYNVIVICHYPIDDFDGNNEVWDDSAHKWIYNHKFNGGRVISYKSSAPVVFHNESVVEYYAEARFNMRNRVDDGYSQSQPYPNYTKGTTNNIGEIIKAWMDNHPDNMTQGKMIAWLCGHTHMDYMWYSLKYPDILCVVIDQAGCLRGTNTGDRDATLESRTCANYYSIDTQNGLLKIVRIGYTMNKLMNSHEYLCYDYVNKKVLNEG